MQQKCCIDAAGLQPIDFLYIMALRHNQVIERRLSISLAIMPMWIRTPPIPSPSATSPSTKRSPTGTTSSASSSPTCATGRTSSSMPHAGTASRRWYCEPHRRRCVGRCWSAYCDLMTTPTKERLAAALARTIYSDIASPVGQAFERAADLFRSLRVRPTIEVDPGDGSLRFSFQVGRRRADIDDTIERLLELLGELAAERKRRVVIVFDEFQEIITLDKRFPNLMRAVFQAQPDVGHVYLGSKRHLLERIFNDRNEPFWRSAKQLEIGTIAAGGVRALPPRPLRRDGQGHHRRRTRPAPRGDRRAPVWHPGAGLLRLGAHAGRRRGLGARRRGGRRPGRPLRAQSLRAALGRRPPGPAARHAGPRRRAHPQRLCGGLPRAARPPGHSDAPDRARRPRSGRRSSAGATVRVYRIIEPFLAEWLLREQGPA